MEGALQNDTSREEIEILEIKSKLLPKKSFELGTCISEDRAHHYEKDIMQRLLQYSLADAKFEQDYNNFCMKSTPLTTTERNALFVFISKYSDQEYLTDDVLDLIPKIDRFLLGQLPCKYAPILGAAGTGKTTATANMAIKSNTIAVCGATNPAFGNFMTELQQNTKPGSYCNIMKETIYKLTNIKYGDPLVKACLETLGSNKLLHDSYSNLVRSSTLFLQRQDTQTYLYNHMKIVFKALHPLLHCTINNLKASYQPAYRLAITDENHPYYQPEAEVFDFIKVKRNQTFEQKNVPCNHVLSIDAYQALVMMQCSELSVLPHKKHLLPNIMTLVNKVIVDEAGRLPAYFNVITCFIWWFLQFTYNTPMLYESIPVISPSGSDSQSSVIDFPVSMLDEAISPALIWDSETVLAYKSEHNRRKINAFTDLKTSMHNATCLSLENFQINDFTYKTFMFSETFPELLRDPRVRPNAIRMFPFHLDCDEFIQAMHSQGNANIETRDNIFVSSDITLVHHIDYNHTNTTDEHLSILSEEEAQKNRLRMWRAKKDIYSEGYVVKDDEYRKQLMCAVKMASDIGFSSDLEYNLCNTYSSLQHKQAALNSTGKEIQYESLTDDHLEEIKYREYMRKTYENVNMDFSDSEHDIRFICGPASKMLSREEHRLKRIHALGLEEELGDGSELSRHYYSASIAQGQKPIMKYDPKYDICIEIADPNYNGDDALLQDSIFRTVNARTLYMCISRKRYFSEKCSVVSGIHRTAVVLHGVNGTINKIIYSECFGSSHITFRLLTYCGILEEYQKWIYSITLRGSDIDIFSLEKDHIREIGKELDIPIREKEIIQSFEKIISLSCDKSSKAFKLNNTTKTDLVSLNIPELHDSLKRLVMKALHVSQEFGEVKLKYFIENCDLVKTWKFLLTSASRVTYIDKTQYCNHGDLIVLNRSDQREVGSKTSQCNTTEWERKMIGKKTLFSIINRTVHDIFPDLVQHTSMSLLLKGVLIARTHPTILLQNVRLFNILNCKSNLYGLMMRLSAASLPQKTETLMHKIFSVNGGECMNFPRPFIVAGTEKPSNIILKCKHNIFPYSSYLKGETQKVSTRKIESFAVLPLMNPLFIEVASTVDAMQGKTMTGQSMVDLGSMTTPKQLVAVTRNNSLHNLFTSNVSRAMNTTVDPSLNITVKQNNKKLVSPYFKYR